MDAVAGAAGAAEDVAGAPENRDAGGNPLPSSLISRSYTSNGCSVVAQGVRFRIIPIIDNLY